MVPAYIAGIDQRDQISINLRWLAQEAQVDFIQAEIVGLEAWRTTTHESTSSALLAAQPQCGRNHSAPALQERHQHQAPLGPALEAITQQDQEPTPMPEPFHIVGAGLAAIELAFALQ